jgi:hypothetical protein
VSFEHGGRLKLYYWNESMLFSALPLLTAALSFFPPNDKSVQFQPERNTLCQIGKSICFFYFKSLTNEQSKNSFVLFFIKNKKSQIWNSFKKA